MQTIPDDAESPFGQGRMSRESDSKGFHAERRMTIVNCNGSDLNDISLVSCRVGEGIQAAAAEAAAAGRRCRRAVGDSALRLLSRIKI